ncbi:L-seryl-tRNA(Sec) selenium transferase [Fimbriiglobus ruber]|uniref:L-seryl-tRNA(Sec) selenium transferase n=1 Tax=Fimbriiglobus ruber TaxID=1908690 RepID=A0A225E0W9_9BACT|nr:L-seryl-tRNA(Sec) selenium transferase [Fimbriiglobus ruber]OWK46813.1 L-seryl-tRNA(Sec) selenium transferase [Fimbriiglobus ruber]
MSDRPYHLIPAVSKVLALPEIAAASARFGHEAVATAVRDEVDQLRAVVTAGQALGDERLTPNALATRVLARLADAAIPTVRPVINATGIILHTNLGRSPVHETAALAAYEAARGYLNLEMDLATGSRSSRQDGIRAGIQALTGAESATAVNNCAAATVIVLRTLAQGKEVIVSRGQLIEIGGSFRIPDIMATSGAILREVGTTNITRARDYETAIGPNTGLIMRIHASNFRVSGFTQSVGIDELVAIGKRCQIPVVDDVGSGLAVDLSAFGLTGEPLVSDGIRAGADLVMFSGDKLLGGPQAGIIAGRASLIQRIERDPLMRAFRLDKMTLAALEATLRLYRDPARAVREIPTLRSISTPVSALRERCERLAGRLRDIEALASVTVRDDTTYVGGGSLPDQALPTVVVALVARHLGETAFSTRLRSGTPAVVGRVKDQEVLLDLRTVFDRQEDDLVAAIRAAAASHPVTP